MSLINKVLITDSEGGHEMGLTKACLEGAGVV